jgi:uncharacterized iron-regulated protein
MLKKSAQALWVMTLLFWFANAQPVVAAVRDLNYFLTSRSLDYVLLGEVHDNELLHRLREQHLHNAHAALEGRRVVLALEQFDLGHQTDIDQFLARLPDAERQDRSTARKLAEAGGFNFSGWAWEFYEPILHMALRRKWEIKAANLSRQQGMAIARGGADPFLESLNIAWTAEESARLSKEIQEGHCGMLPESAIPGMVKAQQARDAQMARAMVQAKGQGTNALVILLAGSGHVRKDWGVPRYLRALDPRASIFAWGFVETPLGEAVSDKVFDEYAGVLPEARPNPCEGLKDQFGRLPKPR